MSIIGLIIVICIIGYICCCRTIHQNYIGLDESFGTYKRTLQPGLHFKWPFIENIRTVPLASVPVTMPGEDVITKDNVDAEITLSLNYHITDPVKYEYKNTDSVTSMKNDVEGELRSVIGTFSLNDALASTYKINKQVFNGIGDLTNTFGVKIDRINITDFKPNSDVLAAMNKQKSAQSEKIAMQQKADGEAQKIATENKANNDAMIKTAEAQAQSRVTKANAQAKAISAVQSAINCVGKNYLANKSIDAYDDLAKAGNMVIVPKDKASYFGQGIAIGKGIQDSGKNK